MTAPSLVAVAFLWPAMLPWLVVAGLPLVLGWWAVRHARRVAWGPIDLVERAARAARMTRSGLPWLLTVARMLLMATVAVAAARPFLGEASSARGMPIVVGDVARRIEVVKASSDVDGSTLALRSALEALARTRPGLFPAVDLVALGDASRAADSPQVIILCDGSVPAADDAARLAGAVQEGATLVVCVGPDSAAPLLLPRLSVWLEGLGGVSVPGSVSLEDEAIIVADAETGQSVGATATLAGPHVSRAAELIVSESARPPLTVLARSATTGRPLLVERRVGLGRLMVSALPLALPRGDDDQEVWSDLAAWPVFVPFVDRFVIKQLESIEERGDSTGRRAGRFGGLALARPLLAGGLLLAVIEAILSWHRGRTAGFLFDVASLGGRLMSLALWGAMFAAWGGRPAEWSGWPRTVPPVAVVIDTSPSMGSADSQPASRLDRLLETVVGGEAGTSIFDGLARDRPVVIHTVADTVRSLGRYPEDVTAGHLRNLAPAPPTPDGSRLGEAVLGMLDAPDSAEAAAVVVMTDGAITGGSSWAAVADMYDRHRVSLVVVPVGDDATAPAGLPTGFRFAAADPPAVCQPDEPLSIAVRGLASTKSPQPLMLEGDVDDARLVVDSTPTEAGYGYSGRINFRPEVPAAYRSYPQRSLDERPAAITQTLTLAVGREDDRHMATLPIVVTDDPIRVLLLDHGPRYEFRFLARLLAGDPRYALTSSLLAARDVEALRVEATLPQSAAAWGEFDVVILGDLSLVDDQEDATAWQALREAVTRDGVGLAWLPGRRWAETDAGIDWLPAVAAMGSVTAEAVSSPRQLRMLPAGRATGWFPSAQSSADATAPPSLPTFSTLPSVSIQPPARVIAITETAAGHDPQPAIVVHQTGQGTIVGHLCDTWRWQSHGEPHDVTDHARYWLHVLPRLAERRRLARLVAATVAVRPLDPLVGETIRVDVIPARSTIDLAAWELAVESPGQPPRRLGIAGTGPGAVATVRLEGLAAGRHRLRLRPPPAEADWPATVIEHAIVVNERLVERAAGPAGTGPLQAAVSSRGGTVVPLDRIDTLRDTIATAIGERRAHGEGTHWLESQSAANLLLAAFVTALTVAWWPRPGPAPRDAAR